MWTLKMGEMNCLILNLTQFLLPLVWSLWFENILWLLTLGFSELLPKPLTTQNKLHKKKLIDVSSRNVTIKEMKRINLRSLWKLSLIMVKSLYFNYAKHIKQKSDLYLSFAERRNYKTHLLNNTAVLISPYSNSSHIRCAIIKLQLFLRSEPKLEPVLISLSVSRNIPFSL